MKVEELIGNKVWIKIDRFRSVPGKIESMSNAVNLDDLESSVSQSRFRIEMLSGKIVEILGSDISKIEYGDKTPGKGANVNPCTGADFATVGTLEVLD
jgi:hypothetical protein